MILFGISETDSTQIEKVSLFYVDRCNSDTLRVSETGSKQIEKSITILPWARYSYLYPLILRSGDQMKDVPRVPPSQTLHWREQLESEREGAGWGLWNEAAG